jgi:pilus assembly protein CpaF
MSLTDRLAQRYSTGGDSNGRHTRTTVPVPASGGSAAALRLRVHRELLAILGPQLYDNRTADAVLEQKVRDTIDDVLARDDSPLAVADPARIAAELLDEILGHGPIEPLLRDPDVTEIMVNGPNRIYAERFGRINRIDATFVDEHHLRRVIDRIVSRVGRRVDESSPMVDARLPDGSRVNAVLPPVAIDGPTLTIRKFAREAFTIDDLIGLGTVTAEVAQLLYACIRARLDILITGGTGCGKTTTLNVISSFLPTDERIITIEDAAELQLRQSHVLRLESRPPNIEGRGEITIRDLVRNALRMRPDRIVIGEVRDAAALDLLQAMNTGHNGSLTTVHANSPRDSIARVETMALMAGLELPVRAIREQIASAIDLIVHQERLRDGSRRVTHVTEVLGMEGDVVTMQNLFTFDHRAGYNEHGQHTGSLTWTGLRPQLLDTLADAGVPVPVGLFEGKPFDGKQFEGSKQW